ncbi:hypothetical protein C8Q75DRAFT_709149, partial [Abortiporus biennis]
RGSAAQSLRPVTVKQLFNATQAHTDAEWHIDDIEVGQISLVAQVMSIQAQTTNCVYWLDDGTGRIEARHWVDSSTMQEDGVDPNGIKEHDYIRVMGNLKTFGNKRYVNATHLRVCSDPYEPYFHTLDVCATKLILERGPAGGISAYQNQTHAATSDQYSHLPPLERAICVFLLEQPPNDEGIHVGNIARAVQGSPNDISAALDKLLDDGHIYTTLDESHYALSV